MFFHRLNRYYDTQAMMQHIQGIRYMGQTTNTPAALAVRILQWPCS